MGKLVKTCKAKLHEIYECINQECQNGVFLKQAILLNKRSGNGISYYFEYMLVFEKDETRPTKRQHAISISGKVSDCVKVAYEYGATLEQSIPDMELEVCKDSRIECLNTLVFSIDGDEQTVKDFERAVDQFKMDDGLDKMKGM